MPDTSTRTGHTRSLPARAQRLLLGAVLGAAAVVAPLPLGAIEPARAEETVLLPFRGGQSVRIIQGYNGGSHQGRSRFALDLLLASGTSSGAEVLSPIAGTVAWAFAPGTGNGCMAIALAGGSYSVMLCHVALQRSFRRGEPIQQGQVIGTVGAPGTVGNNGTAHVHLELHRGAQASSPIPFSAREGLPLEGLDLPATGARTEHAARPPITSTNGLGRGSQPAAGAGAAPPDATPAASPSPSPSPSPGPRPPAPAANASPAEPQPAAASPAPAEERAQQRTGASSTAAAASPRAARVEGTDSCLKLRASPSLDAPTLDCLPDGTDVPLTAAVEQDERYRWREIAERGWVVADYLRRTRAVVSGVETCLNVRQQPSTEAPILRCLPEGTSVSLAHDPPGEAVEGWLRLDSSAPGADGGWVASAYVD